MSEAAQLNHAKTTVGELADELASRCPEAMDFAKALPLEHYFAPGVYMRQIFMPKGTFVIGHKHRTRHANIVISGRARILMDGKVHEVVGPCTFNSDPGVQKALYILEDTTWMTIHPTDETDMSKLEAQLIEKSEAYQLLEQEQKLLKEGVHE